MRNDAIQLDSFWDILTRLKDDVTECLDALEQTPEEDEVGRSFWRRRAKGARISVLR